MEQNNKYNFEDIRPIRDEEVKDAIKQLINDKSFIDAAKYIVPDEKWNDFLSLLQSCDNVEIFQKKIIVDNINPIIKKTSDKVIVYNWDKIDPKKGNLLISNHRDIILDPAIINIHRSERNIKTTEIAIGNNLIIYPWINLVMRLNKSFLVKRNLPMHEKIDASKQLSSYIADTISNREESIWIAQAEGRAKDSNDKTQISLLKMLAINNKENVINHLKLLNIVPLSISYEYDPCDYLKAEEFQLKRDNEKYTKSISNDLKSMFEGIKGYKGNIYFTFCDNISSKINDIKSTKINEIIAEVANIIDISIYKNYKFFKSNYIAYDYILNCSKFSDKYSKSDKEQFNNYIETQISKIDIPNKDYNFLRTKILEMYSNTLINNIKVTESNI